MAKPRGKNEKPLYNEAVSFILEKKGRTYEEWEREIVNGICVSVLAGENVEWRNKMLEQASIEMIAADIEKRKQAQEKSTNSHVQSDVKTQGN
ncbi:hypothetical protein FT637_25015 [Bacillus cereus]|uniref:hypothetical protein n=1 Tax=Bacillus cereus TaxID=1396 RepID=UPI00187A3327|nr:hypothetical protein [Bacillus cereus]MBE7106150.1 hypothetical protein [Bacillus cereus]